MSSLSFSAQYKLLNLSPFKYGLCALIHSLFRYQTIKERYNTHLISNIIHNLINDFDCEISKMIFFKKLSFECYKNSHNHSIDPENLYSDLSSIIEHSFHSINNMNDLYTFFNMNIRELKSKDDNNVTLLDNGGYFDNFIRKCLFAFYKLTFGELNKLISDIHKYNNNEDIRLNLTQRESEMLFEKQINNMTYRLTDIERNRIDESLLSSLNYKHKFLFSNNIDGIHKFFDFNLKYFYEAKDSAQNKIHYSLLNLVDYYFSNNYYDESLQSIFI
jgi:hypothetical protein